MCFIFYSQYNFCIYSSVSKVPSLPCQLLCRPFYNHILLQPQNCPWSLPPLPSEIDQLFMRDQETKDFFRGQGTVNEERLLLSYCPCQNEAVKNFKKHDKWIHFCFFYCHLCDPSENDLISLSL